MNESELTKQDLEILCAHFAFLRELESGNRLPTTDAEIHFVKVCQGLDLPCTEYEQAFLKWMILRPSNNEMKTRLAAIEKSVVQQGRGPRQVSSKRISTGIPKTLLHEIEQRYGQPSGQEVTSVTPEELVKREKERQERAARSRIERSAGDFTPRFIEESWGTREAWKKDSARNRFNGR